METSTFLQNKDEKTVQTHAAVFHTGDVEVISSISSLRLKADVTDEKCQSNRDSVWVVIFLRKLINKFAFWMLKSATFFFFFGSSFVHSLKSNTSDTERNEYFWTRSLITFSKKSSIQFKQKGKRNF